MHVMRLHLADLKLCSASDRRTGGKAVPIKEHCSDTAYLWYVDLEEEIDGEEIDDAEVFHWQFAGLSAIVLSLSKKQTGCECNAVIKVIDLLLVWPYVPYTPN